MQDKYRINTGKIQDNFSGNEIYEKHAKIHVARLQHQLRYFIRT